MFRKGLSSALLLLSLFLFPRSVDGCTTIIVTRGASADGSVMVSHSDDNDLMDQRIIYVPARSTPPDP